MSIQNANALDDPLCQRAIDAILTNDEASSDEELVAHFQTFGLTEDEARAQVARRSEMLNRIFPIHGKTEA